MANFDFLLNYLIPEESMSNIDSYAGYKHKFYPINKDTVHNVEKFIFIPDELKEFYLKIGYGFMYAQSNHAFNRFLDVESFKMINLKEDYYAFDSQLELYDSLYEGGKLLFFEIIEGHYLAIDKESVDNKNAVFYFDKKIANSLAEFLTMFDLKPELLEELA